VNTTTTTTKRVQKTYPACICNKKQRLKTQGKVSLKQLLNKQ